MLLSFEQWQRAETLGALVNGVFLVALCLSIFLEAIQRFFEPQEVTQPKLILIVGCCGLASNVLGLLLFHDHGHGHGDSKATEATSLSAAEEGQASPALNGTPDGNINEGGTIAEVLPETVVAGIGKSGSLPKDDGIVSKQRLRSSRSTRDDDDVSTAVESTSPVSMRKSYSVNSHNRHKRHTGINSSRQRHSSFEDIHIHPVVFRNDMIARGSLEDIQSPSGTESEGDATPKQPASPPSETSHLLENNNTKSYGSASSSKQRRHSLDIKHHGHNHRQPKSPGKSGSHSHSHSHGDLNMRGVFLHVMGDALGNLGVIASALFIWLTTFSWRFYSDPAISLVITVIILHTAIPLCRAASRILLQAVPAGLSVDEIRADIEDLPGVVSCHHLHVWQLSDTKLVASLHVQLEFDFKGAGSKEYMRLAKAVRTCLHEYGIHECTIQPEFCLDSQHRHAKGPLEGGDAAQDDSGQPTTGESSKTGSNLGSRTASVRSLPDGCLLECDDACGVPKCSATTKRSNEDLNGK